MTEKTPNLLQHPLQKAYAAFTDKGKEGIRKRCQKLLDWSPETFYRRIKNPDSMSRVEKEAIAKIFGKTVPTLFPKAKMEVMA